MQASTNHVYTRLDISTSLSAAAALPPLNALFSAWQKIIDYTYTKIMDYMEVLLGILINNRLINLKDGSIDNYVKC
jgi:hypothetical protein